LDTITAVTGATATSTSVGGRTHSQLHNDTADAVEAVQAELGVNPRGSYATVVARLDALTATTVPARADWTGAVTLNVSTADYQAFRLTGSSTVTISGAPASGKLGIITVELTQDTTGARTVTWPASVKWSGGTAPTLSTAINKIDMVQLTTRDGGTTWLGALVGIDFR
jgi:hypothetical protein